MLEMSPTGLKTCLDPLLHCAAGVQCCSRLQCCSPTAATYRCSSLPYIPVHSNFWDTLYIPVQKPNWFRPILLFDCLLFLKGRRGDVGLYVYRNWRLFDGTLIFLYLNSDETKKKRLLKEIELMLTLRTWKHGMSDVHVQRIVSCRHIAALFLLPHSICQYQVHSYVQALEHTVLASAARQLCGQC
jgi:hypothetical protein